MASKKTLIVTGASQGKGTGGSVTSITASLVENPIAGLPASIPMITKGGLNAITISLASEYAKDIAEAVVYLTEARHVTREVLHVDGGQHTGHW